MQQCKVHGLKSKFKQLDAYKQLKILWRYAFFRDAFKFSAIS